MTGFSKSRSLFIDDFIEDSFEKIEKLKWMDFIRFRFFQIFALPSFREATVDDR